MAIPVWFALGHLAWSDPLALVAGGLVGRDPTCP